MGVDAVALSGFVSPRESAAEVKPAGTSGGEGAFGKVLDQMLSSEANSHQGAQAAIRDLATGQTDNLHGVMLQVAQADLSFRLILEIRNRLTEAYQEIMKMNV